MQYVPIVSPPFYRHVRGHKFLMLEAPYVLADEACVDYHTKLRPPGLKIILDNGAALGGKKESIGIDALMEAVALVKADEIVVPDVMYNYVDTLCLAAHHAPHVTPAQRFFVPQGETASEWLRCADIMLQKYTMATLGVPKHLDKLPGGRTHILAQLKERHPELGNEGYPAVHLLGVWGDPLEVLWLARRFPWVRSVDTSIPEVYGRLGVSMLKGYKQFGKKPYEYITQEDFANSDSVMQNITRQFVVLNIKLMTRWAQGRVA